MSVPLQISFRDMESSPTVESHVREHADRLERFHQRIMSCHVVIHAPHRHHRKGRLYHVSIDVTVPGHEIAVNRDPPGHHAHEDMEVAVRDAFDAIARRLEDVVRRSRGDVKSHQIEPHGRVARLFAEEGYGFIATPDEGDIYFHENSVQNGAFRRLKVGAEVRYRVALGENGLQATVVKPVGKHRPVS